MPSRKQPRANASRAVRALFLLLVLFVAAWFASPILLARYTLQRLADAGIAASLQGARVDPLSFSVGFEGLRIGTPGGAALYWRELVLRLDPIALLSGHLRIRDVRASGVRLETAAATPGEIAAGATVASDVLPVTVGALELSDVALEVDGVPLTVRHVALGGVDRLAGGAPATLSARVAVAGGTLAIHGTLSWREGRGAFQGRVRGERIALAGLRAWLSAAGARHGAGLLRADGSLTVNTTPGDRTLVTYEGAIDASGLALALPAADIEGGDAGFKGRLSVRVGGGGTPGLAAAGGVHARALSAVLAKKRKLEFKDAVLDGHASTQGSSGAGPLSLTAGFSAAQVALDGGAGALVARAVHATLVAGPGGSVALHRIAGRTILFTGAGGVRARLDQPQASRLALADGALRVENVQGVHAVGTALAGKVHVGWKLDGFSLAQLDVAADGEVTLTQTGAAAVTASVADERLAVQRPRVERATWKAGAGLAFGPVSLDALHEKSASGDVWLNGVHAQGARVGPRGSLQLHALAAKSLSWSGAGQSVEGTNLSLAGLRRTRAGALKLRTARAAGVRWLQTGGGTLELGSVSLGGLGRDAKGVLRIGSGSAARLVLNEGARSLRAHSVKLAGGHDDAHGARADALFGERVTLSEPGRPGLGMDALTIENAHADTTSFAARHVAAARLTARSDDLGRAVLMAPVAEGFRSGGGAASAGTLRADEVDWVRGKSRLALRAPVFGDVESGPGGVVAQRLDGSGASLSLAGAELDVAALSARTVQLPASGGLSLAALSAKSPVLQPGGKTHARAGGVALTSLQVPDMGPATIASLQLQAPVVATADPDIGARAAAAQLDLAGLILADTTRVAKAVVTDLQLRFGRDNAGKWRLPWMRAASAPAAPPLAIQHLELAGEGRATFVDHAVKPAVAVHLIDLAGTMQGLDGTDPDASARFDAAARIGDFAQVAGTGNIGWTVGGTRMSLKASLSALPVTTLAGYARSSLGLDVKGGLMDVKLSLHLDAGLLEGQGKVVLSKLDASAAGGLTAAGMRLDTALELIENRDDVARFNVDVSGNADDPTFSSSDLVRQAVVRGVQSAVKLTLQPLGFLVGAAGGLLAGGHGLALQPVRFAPGADALGAEQQSYLDKLGARLGERPNMRVRLCAVTTPADAEVLSVTDTGPAPAATPRARELALAARRASAVADYLAQHGVPAEQMLDCKPVVSGSDDDAPRVNIIAAAARVSSVQVAPATPAKASDAAR